MTDGNSGRIGSPFAAFLEEEGLLEDAEAVALERVRQWRAAGDGADADGGEND